MIDLELPLKKRTAAYRFFEMLPAILSYGMIVLLIFLSLLSPLVAAIYLLLIIITVLVKAVGIAVHTISGRSRLDGAQEVDWHARLMQLEDPIASYESERMIESSGFGFEAHKENLRLMSADPTAFPKPSSIYNAVIIAAYNESYEVLEPTIQSVVDSKFDNKKIMHMNSVVVMKLRKQSTSCKKNLKPRLRHFML